MISAYPTASLVKARTRHVDIVYAIMLHPENVPMIGCAQNKMIIDPFLIYHYFSTLHTSVSRFIMPVYSLNTVGLYRAAVLL